MLTRMSTRAAATSRELIESFAVPTRSGRASAVPQGHVCRITTPEAHSLPTSPSGTSATPERQDNCTRRTSPSTRIMACLRYLRPLVTITGDSLEYLGADEAGVRVDLLGIKVRTFCNKRVVE